MTKPRIISAQAEMFKSYFETVRKFISFKAYDKKLMCLLFLASLLRVLSWLVIPYVAALIIDAITAADYTATFFDIGVFLAAYLVYVAIAHWEEKVIYAKNANYIHDALQEKILQKVVSFDTSFAEELSQEEIVSTAFQDTTYAQRIPDFVFDFITAIASVFVTVVILIFVNFWIGMIVGATAIMSFSLFCYHMAKRNLLAIEQRKHEDNIAHLYSQVVDGFREVHAFNLQENLREILEKNKDTWHKTYRKKRLHQDLAEALSPIFLGLSRILIYLVAAGLVLAGEYNISLVVLVIGYLESIQNDYESAMEMVYEVSRCSVAIDRLYRVLNYRTSNMLKFGANNLDDIRGSVEFKKVSFSYENQSSLKNVSFKISPRKLVAIVGKSGSGKSTIFRLLLRFYKSSRGEILVDDIKISDYTPEVYATNVSIVSQKPFVFDMTIRQNLNLVDSDKKHQIAACKAADVYDAIMKLPKGFDTPLVANASNLSGGQKQLLALARTLLSKSEILLFDEVTAGLDPKTSAKIVEIFHTLKKNHTILMITHKPELMRLADEILVIDKGRLVARGRHNALSKNSRHYQALQNP